MSKNSYKTRIFESQCAIWVPAQEGPGARDMCSGDCIIWTGKQASGGPGRETGHVGAAA